MVNWVQIKKYIGQVVQYNTYFWIDYKEKLIGILFPNTAPFGHLGMMEKFKILTLQAIE